MLNLYDNPRLVKRLLIIGLIVVAIIVVVLAVHQSTQGTLYLKVAPSDASLVTSTGRKLKYGSNSVPSGEYTITASRSHFITQTFTAQVTHGNTTVSSHALDVADAAGLQYYADHPDQQALANGITGQRLEAQATQMANNNPILKHLPQTTVYYAINYGQSKLHPSDPTKFALYITSANDTTKNMALDWIKANGFNPNNYEIVYQDVATYQAQLNNTATPAPTTGSSTSSSASSNIDTN